jgi:hypothetical protein
MRRYAIGAIALVLLLGAAGLQFCPWNDANAADLESACLRIGAVMAVVWLAYQHLEKMPAWLWFVLPVFVLVIARRPRWLLFLIPLAIVLAILRPRSHSRRVRRP